MKRLLPIILVLVLLCSTAFAAGFEVPAEGYDGSEVTVRFYSQQGSTLQGVLNTYIAEFNQLYPNIHIEHTTLGDYDGVRDQIVADISVGAQPNVAYCYPDHVALYNLAKSVQTLDALIDSTVTVTRADGSTEILGLTDEQKADFIEGYYEEGRQYGDGLMYTMPFSKSTEVLYYDKTFFDANGIAVPTTWDEMEQVCAKLKELDPQSIPLGYDSESNWFITMCEQYNSPYTSATGDHYLFNNETNRAFIKRFAESVCQGLCDHPEALRRVYLRPVYRHHRRALLHVHRLLRRRQVSASYRQCGWQLSL